jgi:hypothetical protein
MFGGIMGKTISSSLGGDGFHWQVAIIDQVDFTTAEPAAPTTGDRYINTVTGTSSITAQPVTINYIYEWSGTIWTETVPQEGFALWDETANAIYVFDGTSWNILSTSLWKIIGSDIKTITDPLNVDLQNGGLKDNDVTTAVAFGDASNTSLNTTNKTLLGGINEVHASLPNAVEDILTVASDGQTAFTLSNTPSSDAAFTLYLNGQLAERTVDYTRSGTSITWINGGSLGPLVTTDYFVALYNDTAISVPPKSVMIFPDSNANYGNRRVRSIAATGAYRLNFYVPKDFLGSITVKVIGYPTSGAGGTGKDIDIIGEYTTGVGLSATQYTFSDTTSTYDLGSDDTRTEIDITSLFTNLTARSEGGFLWDNNGIGGPFNIVGIEITNT